MSSYKDNVGGVSPHWVTCSKEVYTASAPVGKNQMSFSKPAQQSNPARKSIPARKSTPARKGIPARKGLAPGPPYRIGVDGRKFLDAAKTPLEFSNEWKNFHGPSSGPGGSRLKPKVTNPFKEKGPYVLPLRRDLPVSTGTILTTPEDWHPSFFLLPKLIAPLVVVDRTKLRSKDKLWKHLVVTYPRILKNDFNAVWASLTGRESLKVAKASKHFQSKFDVFPSRHVSNVCATMPELPTRMRAALRSRVPKGIPPNLISVYKTALRLPVYRKELETLLGTIIPQGRHSFDEEKADSDEESFQNSISDEAYLEWLYDDIDQFFDAIPPPLPRLQPGARFNGQGVPCEVESIDDISSLTEEESVHTFHSFPRPPSPPPPLSYWKRLDREERRVDVALKMERYFEQLSKTKKLRLAKIRRHKPTIIRDDLRVIQDAELRAMEDMMDAQYRNPADGILTLDSDKKMFEIPNFHEMFSVSAMMLYDGAMEILTRLPGLSDLKSHIPKHEFFALVALLRSTSRHSAWALVLSLSGGSFHRYIVNAIPAMGEFFSEYFWSWVYPDPEFSEEPIIPEGFSEFISDGGDVMKRICNAPITVKTVTFFAKIYASTILMLDPKSALAVVLTTMYEAIAQSLSGVSNLEVFFSLATYWGERVSKFADTGDWKQLFELSPEHQAMEDLGACRLELANMTKSTKQPSIVVANARKCVTKYMGIKNALVQKEIVLVHELVCTMSERLTLRREAPTMVIFTGIPGCGKTHLVERFADFVKKVHGIEPGVEIMHQHTHAAYQRPQAVTLIYGINDYFTTKDEHMEGEGALTFIQSLCDTAPYDMQAASIAAKDLAGIAPDWVPITTNNYVYDLAKTKGGTDKLDRRGFVVDVTIDTDKWKDMFDMEPTPAIVAEMLKQNHPGDVFKYTVGLMSNLSTAKTLNMNIKKVLHVCGSLNELFVCLFRLRQKKLESSSLLRELCDACTMPAHECGCDSIKQVQSLLQRSSVKRPMRVVPQGGLCPRRVSLLSVPDSMVSSLETQLKETNDLIRKATAKPFEVKVSHDFGSSVNSLASRLSRAGLPASWNLPNLARFTVFLGGSVALIGMIRQFITSFFPDLIRPQGAMITTLSEPLPDPEVYVRPNSSSSVPWVNGLKNSLDLDVLINGLKMHALMVTHTIMAVPKHFFLGTGATSGPGSPAAPRDLFSVTYGGHTQQFMFSPEGLVVSPSKDLCFYFLGGLASVCQPVYDLLPVKAVLPKVVCALGYLGRVEVWQNGADLAYHASTVAGDCGIPLTDPSGNVYGFHVGYVHGSLPKMGVATTLCREEVDAALAEFGQRGLAVFHRSDVVNEGLLKQSQGPGLHPNSDIGKWVRFGHGTCESADHVPLFHNKFAHTPTCSARESSMFKTFGDKVIPHGKPFSGKAEKTPSGEWRSPSIYRIETRAHSVASPDVGRLLTSADHLLADIPQPDHPLMPLCFHRAVCGDRKNVLMNPRDSTKSVGLILKLAGVTTANSFVKVGDDWVPHPKLVAEFERLHMNAKSHEALCLTYCVATLKDEVYPMAKTILKKGRLFYVNDLCMNLLLRMYLLPLMTYLMELPQQTGINVTMNCGSEQFTSLYKLLMKFGPDRSFDGDQESFDLRHQAVMEVVAGFFRSLALKCGYSDEDARVTARVFSMASRYVLEMGGNFYFCSSGLTSGRADTILVNCIILALLSRYAFQDVMVLERLRRDRFGEEPTPPGPFHDYVVETNTGDDNVTSVSADSAFTGEIMANRIRELGYKMTAGDKSSTISFRNLSEISYLQRRFRVDPTSSRLRVYAPLGKKSIFRALAYCLGMTPEEEAERNVSTASCMLREAFMHGEEFFEELTLDLKKELPDMKYLSFSQIKQEYELGVFKTWGGNPHRGTYLEEGGNLPHPDASSGQPSVVLPEGNADSGNRPLQPSGEEGEALPPLSRYVRRASAIRVPYDRTGARLKRPIATLNTDDVQVNSLLENPVTSIGFLAADSDSVKPGRHDLRDVPTEVQLQKFLARPRLLTTFSSPVRDVLPTILSVGWRAIPQVDDIVKHYGLWRGDPTVTVAYTGGSQYLGRGRIFFYPKRQQDCPYETDCANISVMGQVEVADRFTPISSSLPYLDLDFSLAQTLEMKLKFPWSRTFILPGETDWEMRYQPLNPQALANGLTPADLVISVYVGYENVEFQRIVPQGEVESGTMSNLLAYSSRIASSLPFNWASPLSMGLSLGSEVAHYFGFAKPPFEPQTAIVQRNMGNPSLASGQPDFSFSLGMNPGACRDVSRDAFPMKQEGETTLSFMASKQIELVTNYTLGTGIVVTPGTHVPTSFFADGRFYNTSLGFLGSMFNYWTGELDLCVQVMASPLIRWRIAIQIIPPGIATPLVYNGDGSYLTTIMEVTGSTCVDVTVPYLYLEPFQTFEFFSTQVDDISQTRVVIFSVVDPTGPAPTPVFPYINLWIKGGSDFNVGVPTLEAVTPFEIVPEGGVEEASISHFGEIIDDLTLLTRRFSNFWEGHEINELDTSLSFPVQIQCPQIPGSIAYDVTQHTWSWASYIAAAYLGESGSYAYKIHRQSNASQNVVGSAVMIPGVPIALDETFAGTFSGRGAMIYDARDGPVAEVRFPDRNRNLFRSTGNFVLAPIQLTPVESFFVEADGTTNNQIHSLWGAGGDDFVFGGYLHPPILRPLGGAG